MNASIHDQLHDYVDDVISQSVPVDLDEITGGRRPAKLVGAVQPASKPAKARRRSWLAVAVAAGAVFVVIGGTALLMRTFTSNTDVGTTPTPAPDALPDAIPSLLTWTRITDDDVFGDEVPFTAGMRDVTVGGPGLVSVGEVDDGAGVWTSIDGITWSRVTDNESAFAGIDTMWSVAAGEHGLVAVGGPRGPEHEGGDGDAAVWNSEDGTTWSRVPHDESVFGGEGEQQMVSVTAGGPGLVAVGWDTSSGSMDAAVWTSPDGFTWSRVPDPESVFGGEQDQAISSVTIGGPGFVAVGSDGFLDVDRGQLTGGYDDIISVAAVWTSVDGLTWTRVPHDETIFGGEGNQWMSSVTLADSGLFAVGGDWSTSVHDAAVWTSVDGIGWSRVPNDGSVFGGDNDQTMSSVTAVGNGLVAVGRAWAQSDSGTFTGHDSAASVWISDDGSTWSWLGYDEAVFGAEDNRTYRLDDGVFTESRQFMSSVITTDRGVVAVGADWAGPSHGAALWVATQKE